MKEAERFSVDLFAIDVTMDGDEGDVGLKG